MIRILTLSLCFVALTIAAAAQRGPGAGPTAGPAMVKPSSPALDALVAKAKNGDAAVDFKALRLAFAEAAPPMMRGADGKTRVEMVKLFNEKKYKESLQIADGILGFIFVDINAHMVASMIHQNLGDAKKAKLHESIYVGLVNSILNGGDGNSTKTAYHVISLAEEVAVLNAIDLKRGTQEPLDEGGSKYHVLTVTDKAGADAGKVYFNVDLVAKGPTTTPVKN